MNNRILALVSGIALAGTTLYWRRRERTVREGLTMSRDWEANTNRREREDQDDRRAAREAAEHLDARIRDLPERIAAVDEERRDLRRELDAVREQWADLWWNSYIDETAPADDESERDGPQVLVVEFDNGELPDTRAFAKRALDEDAITLIAAHGDNSFAVAVGDALTGKFSAEDIARELTDETGGGAGGSDLLATGGGATGALGDGCRTIREELIRSDAVRTSGYRD